MPKIDRIFNGILNLDDDAFRVVSNDYIDALNVTRDAKFIGQDKVLTNINGNQQISFSLPSGTNKCIGSYGDWVRNRLYYFVYNSNGYHSILYYNGLTNTVVKLLQSKTDSNGVDILNFNLSYRVLSINIIYVDTGDLLFFNDGYNPPRVINTLANYGTSWISEYLDVAKAPPQMPPKCVYENDTNVNINNLRNALFQFRYRFVYNNNFKSVWGAAGIVPLPFQPSNNLTQDDYHNNSRISLSVSTGSPEVKGIEIAVRQTKNGTTTDWMLINSFVKSDLSISDNDIFTYKFYNDGVYTPIDVKDTSELQDYVPQVAQAQELLNGTNLIYGNITEGYDRVNGDLTLNTQAFSSSPFYYDYNGTLFFATINGVDSGSQGTILKIYLYGTGTNTAGAVTTLNNGNAIFSINVQNSTYANIGYSYTSAVDNPTVSSILTAYSAGLVANGFTQVSLVGNILTMSYPTTLTTNSSGTKTAGSSGTAPTNSGTTHYTYPFQSAYSFGVQYFDSKGRTNGVVTSVNSTNTLPVDNGGNMTPQLIINHKPPLWAEYYQIVRTLNNTYNYRLDWVTNGAYSDQYANILGVRYAYLEIDNIQQFNQNISSSTGIVGYEFQPGDRVRISGRYNATGDTASFTNTYDYEVLGTVTSFVLNGVVKYGNFLKIYYPYTDIGSDFKFNGDPDYLAYNILIYNYAQHSTLINELFYEFGKCFGIGNAGTINNYHIGLEQTQDTSLSSSAKVTVANGDFFTRSRTVPIGQTYTFTTTGENNGFVYISLPMTLSGSTVTNSLYTVHNSTLSQSNALYPGDYDSAKAFFLNLSSSLSLTVRVRCTIPITVDGNTSSAVLLQAVNSDGTYTLTTAVDAVSMTQGNAYNLVVDRELTIQPLAKLHLIIQNTSQVVNQNITGFSVIVDVINNVTIPIVESGFSDIYQLTPNNDGRATAIDVNAKHENYPTLVRFSGTYQEDTSINQTNRFSYGDADEYDRTYGSIMRLHVRERYMKVYQNFKVGNVPVLTQVVQDTATNPLQAQSDRLINKIQYYQGDFGIGFSPASLAWNNFADYFVDDVRGVVCRLSQDGIQPLSIIYKTNAFFSNYLRYFRTDLNDAYYVPDGNAAVLGAFDPYTNKYIVALEEINRYTETIPHTLVFHQDAYTMVFAETRDETEGFESFVSYQPEMMGVLNNSFATFKDGNIWFHNSGYCNFYGTQYPCYITLVFNDLGTFKKTFLALTETGKNLWVAPNITTSMYSYGTTQQQSELKDVDFKTLESTYNATFKRDINSQGGIINGASLKGEYIIIKLQVNSDKTNNLVVLNSASVKFIESHYNSR